MSNKQASPSHTIPSHPTLLPIRNNQRAGPGCMVAVLQKHGPPLLYRVERIIRRADTLAVFTEQAAYSFLAWDMKPVEQSEDVLLNPWDCYASCREAAQAQLRLLQDDIKLREALISESRTQCAILAGFLDMLPPEDRQADHALVGEILRGETSLKPDDLTAAPVRLIDRFDEQHEEILKREMS